MGEKTKMDTNQTKLDYAKELANLKELAQYWKPNEGKHSLIIKSDPRDTQYVNDKGEVNHQWQFDVELLESPDGKGKRVWNLPKSTSPTSLRGQLIKVGAMKGKLCDEKITLGVQGRGKEKRYTVFEAL